MSKFPTWLSARRTKEPFFPILVDRNLRPCLISVYFEASVYLTKRALMGKGPRSNMCNMMRLPPTLMTPHPSSPRRRGKPIAMSLRSPDTAPIVRTPPSLYKLPPELRYMIYEELLTDPHERELQHDLTLVSKQTQAEFVDTLTRLIAPKTYLVVAINSSSTYYQLGYDVPKNGQAGFHDIFTGRSTENPWYTGWNRFHKGVIGRQMLSRTERVMIKWPFLNTTFWICFEPGSAPDILLKSVCRLSSDARTRVTSKDAEKMLLDAAERWETNKAACSAEWTGVFIRDLRRGWNVLREEASEARKRQAFEEHERRRAARELMKRKSPKNPPF
jgi:hypothetical protein